MSSIIIPSMSLTEFFRKNALGQLNLSYKNKKGNSVTFLSRMNGISNPKESHFVEPYILQKENLENYNQAGKIYVPFISKVNETFFSIFDFLRLLFVSNFTYERHDSHNVLVQELNLNERI